MEWELGKRRGGGLVSGGRREVWEAERELPGGVGVGVSLPSAVPQASGVPWFPEQFPGASLH